MTADMLDLARRAVACPKWRWMPGMLAVEQAVPGMALSPRPVRVDDYWHEVGVWLPDLTDPATLGCLLALYEETRKMLTCPDPVYTYASAYGLLHPRTAEALVAALEAAP